MAMKFKMLLWLAASAVSTWLIFPSLAQDANKATQAEQLTPSKTQNAGEKPGINQVNVDLATARAANRNKRFADAEALMLVDTRSDPEFLYPWVELGKAQLGLEKYDQAETTFKRVLGLDLASRKQGAASGFYDTNGFAANAAPSLAGGSNGFSQERTPQLEGICWSDLGVIDVHANKIADAQSAFDHAANVDPKNAALYRNNETIFFFQAGDAIAQVDAANKAIALDAGKATPYYFKAQGLAVQATIDAKTQKLILPPGCADAYRKYLALNPSGQFADDAKTVLAAAQPGNRESHE
jgi:tetratricopeptide (TPR) repeat protein